MEKFLEFLRTYLGSVYKMPSSELDVLLNVETFDPQAALTAITEKDKARVAQFSGKFQEGVNKGKADALKALEAEIATKYGFEQDPNNPLQGAALVDAIVTTKAGEGVGADISKLTTDDIKKLPAFQPIAREHTAALKAQKTELETRISDIENGHKKAEVFGSVSKTALSILEGLNPVLGESANVAANRKSSFLNSLKDGIDWEQQGDVFVPMKDGKVLTDAHGNALTLEDLAKTKAGDWFEFSANNGGGNSNNGGAVDPSKGSAGGTPAGQYPKNITKPKTFADLTAIVNNKDLDPKDRETVLNVWESEQTGGTGQ